MTDETATEVAAPKKVKVTCTIPNIWTSEGKLLKGQSAELFEEEAEDIKEAMKAWRKARDD